MAFDESQPRDEGGRWTIIRGTEYRHTGKAVSEKDVHDLADKLELSGHARNALVAAHKSGKIKTDEHLYRTVAASDDAMKTGAASSHAGVIKAAVALHGVGGSHEGRVWNGGGNAKAGKPRSEAASIVSAHLKKKK